MMELQLFANWDEQSLVMCPVHSYFACSFMKNDGLSPWLGYVNLKLNHVFEKSVDFRQSTGTYLDALMHAILQS